MTAPSFDPAKPFDVAGPTVIPAPTGRRRSSVARRLRPRANPILRRELRVRMRGRRAFVVLGAYLLLIGLVTFAIERVLVSNESGARLQSFQVGQILFAAFALLEMTLLALVAPALTAPAICGEREHGTFDLLRSTPVRAHTIVWGKLLAALGYAGLLIVASIPIASAVFLFGGVSPRDVWSAFALLGVTTLAFGLLGLCCSAVFRKTGLASVMAYVITAGIIAGSVGAYIFLDAVEGGLVDGQTFESNLQGLDGVQVAGGGDAVSDAGNEPSRILLAINPMMAMASLLADAVDQSPADPWSGQAAGVAVVGDWLEFFRVGDAAFDGGMRFDMAGRPIRVLAPEQDPLWHLTLWIYGIASAVLLLVATLLVARLEGGSRRRWRLSGVRRRASGIRRTTKRLSDA